MLGKHLEISVENPSKTVASWKDLRGYLRSLEEARLLQKIDATVNLKYEIGAICARSIDKNGPALLFENIEGYEGMRLVSNIISSPEQLGVAFRTEPIEQRIYEKIISGMKKRTPPVTILDGPCKENILIGETADLYRFPTPLWHELDGGPYIGTAAGCITRDPVSGFLNIGTYRCMIKDKNTISLAGGVRGHYRKKMGQSSSIGSELPDSGGDHILRNEEKGLATPIAIVLGMDPLLTLASGTSVPPDESGHAEYGAVGTWAGQATEVIKCETSDLLVPAHAEIVLEGQVLPDTRTSEGPHGESTGFYGENKSAFVVKINCITYRNRPITYGIICRLIEDYPRSLLRSGSIQTLLIKKTGKDNIKQVYFPEVGRGGMLIIAADIRYQEEPQEIMRLAWEHTGFRWIIVVDKDCDVRNWNQVMWRVCSAAEPMRDVVTGRECSSARRPDAEIDFEPPSRGMGIDATMGFKGKKFPPINNVSRELAAATESNWRNYGLR